MSYIEVATLDKDWNTIDRAEPETPDGTLPALLTLWDESHDNLTGVTFGVIYEGGLFTRVFTRRAEILMDTLR